MAKLGDAHVVWDLTDPGNTLAAARDLLRARLGSLPRLEEGRLRQWLANALASRTLPLHLMIKKRRIYKARPETAERELKLYRLVVGLRQPTVTRELIDRIGLTLRSPPRPIHTRNGRSVFSIEYYGHSLDFELRLTIGRVMRVEDAVAYAAYKIGFGLKSAYNVFSKYRASGGALETKRSVSGHGLAKDLSPAEVNLMLQMTTPYTAAPPPWLPLLVDHLNRGGELTQDGLLGLLLRALSDDDTLPFRIEFKRGKGHPGDRSLIQRNLDLYYRVQELTQLPLTKGVCAQLEQGISGTTSSQDVTRAQTTVTLMHPSWARRLKLKPGKTMGLDDAIQYAAHEQSLKFRPARVIFLDYRKALSIS